MLRNRMLRGAGGAGGVGPVTSMTVTAEEFNSGTSTIVHTNSSAGDLCVILDIKWNQNTSNHPSYVLPTGFTELYDTGTVWQSDGAYSWRMVVSYKVLESGDLNSTITGMSALYGGISQNVFTPNGAVSSVTTFQSNDSGTFHTANTPQQMFGSNAAAPYLIFGVKGASSSSQNTLNSSIGWTGSDLELFQGYGGAGTRFIVENTTPTDATLSTFDDVSGNRLFGFIFEVYG